MTEQYDEKQIERLREQLSQDFRLSNPGFWQIAYKNQHWMDWNRVQEIAIDAEEKNAALDARRAEDEFKEADRIVSIRGRNAPPPFAGKLSQNLGFPHTPAQEAKLNIAAKITKEKRENVLKAQHHVFEVLRHGEKHAKLNIDVTAHNKTPREDQTLSDKLDQNTERMVAEDKLEMIDELTGHINEGDKARSMLSKAFYERRRDLIEEAIRGGDMCPEATINNAYKWVETSINEYEVHRLHTTFNKFGYEHVKHQFAKEEAKNLILEHDMTHAEKLDPKQAQFTANPDQTQDHQAEIITEAEVSVSDSKQQLHSKEHKQMMLEITKITERADTERIQLNTLFNDNSEEMIEAAKDKGADKPEQAVSDTFNEAMNAIDEKEQKNLSNTFKHYGHDHTQGEERAEARDLLNEQAEQQEETQEQALALYEQKEEQEY